jgi:hypothetical protein
MNEYHQVLTYELTTRDVGDPTALPDLIEQISTPVEGFLGDGAYNYEPGSQVVPAHQPNAKVIILHPKSAVSSVAGDTSGDQHIKDIAEKERITRQCETSYGLRSYIELALQRFKSIFGNTITTRALP